MASIRARKDSGLLLIDFRYRGDRCREQTLMPDSPANRNRLAKLAERIERAIGRDEFVYGDYFPDSPRAQCVDSKRKSRDTNATSPVDVDIPNFSDFAELWFIESEVRWRSRHRKTMRDTLDNVFLPHLGSKRLDQITRADALGFRAELAKRRGRAGQSISAKRINKLMAQLGAIINEGSDRFGFTSPLRGIKSLKQKRSEVLPFTIEESNELVRVVREDYRPYLTTRLLTGLRTGEVNGLQWRDIDFDTGQIRVERTFSRDGDGDTKTDSSKRLIPMVPQVREALERQRQSALPGVEWVFHTCNGNPIDAVNFTNRVWYPLLRNLGLQIRPPYQMRHTAATLMLASGENPEWVAKILGHSTTEMLFRVYSRFVPNLTRDDGRAFAGLLNARHAPVPLGSDEADRLATAMTLQEKRALIEKLTSELADSDGGHPK